MLCLMFVAPNRGVLESGGAAWTDREIAERVGGDTGANLECIAELLAKGVAHRNNRGAIFSRRMVRDEQERQNSYSRVKKHRSKDVVTANETVVVTASLGTATATENAVKKISESSISEIYKHYPRKVGRGHAFKEIGSALQRLLRGEDSPGCLFHSLDDAVVYLAQRVMLFASTPAGQAGEFTPHPATWFHQKRYLDDESEWSRYGTGRANTQQSRSEQVLNTNRAAAAAVGWTAPNAGAVEDQRADIFGNKTVAGEVKRLLG